MKLVQEKFKALYDTNTSIQAHLDVLLFLSLLGSNKLELALE
jgi:hypothetical protein